MLLHSGIAFPFLQRGRCGDMTQNHNSRTHAQLTSRVVFGLRNIKSLLLYVARKHSDKNVLPAAPYLKFGS
jgi:hypothetical protein